VAHQIVPVSSNHCGTKPAFSFNSSLIFTLRHGTGLLCFFSRNLDSHGDSDGVVDNIRCWVMVVWDALFLLAWVAWTSRIRFTQGADVASISGHSDLLLWCLQNSNMLLFNLSGYANHLRNLTDHVQTRIFFLETRASLIISFYRIILLAPFGYCSPFV
jgi:hypothetical protein